MTYVVAIQFTLHVLPENKPVYHQTSVTALVDACKSLIFVGPRWSREAAVLMVWCFSAPPAINASCTDSGIRFTLEHRPFNHPWQITIGSALLTAQLAARHGHVLSNDSQQLQLEVPLFTTGYKYNVRNKHLQPPFH